MNTPIYHLKLPASVIASFERIAKEHCNINTLQTQFRDSLDFHDVHVAGLLRMLNDAYNAGIEKGKQWHLDQMHHSFDE